MNVFWVGATFMALVTFATHTFIGTRFAIPPLVAAEGTVPKATIWLNYLCWHIVTGMLLILTLVMAAVTAGRMSPELLIPCVALFAWVSVVSLVATFKAGIAFYRFPASWLGAATAILAAFGALR